MSFILAISSIGNILTHSLEIVQKPFNNNLFHNSAVKLRINSLQHMERMFVLCSLPLV